jgi:hypothetical protein
MIRHQRKRISTLLALVLAIGLFTAASAQGDTSSNIILDKFDEKNETSLIDHEPNQDIVGGGWSVELGEWEVYKGKAKELSTAPWSVSSDYRATIDSGESNVSVQLKTKIFQDGDQFWGVIARHTGPTDWIMAFHDGVGDLVLGKMVTGETASGAAGPTGFQELGRYAIDWKPGSKAKTHTIRLVAADTAITVYADGEPVISALDHGDISSEIVGMFSRGQGKNQYQEFKVQLPTSGSGHSAAPQTTPEPEDDEDEDDHEDDDEDDDDDDKKGKGKKKKGKK